MVFVQIDVATAFLNVTIDEEVYVQATEGVKDYRNKILKLVKALYGLKQAPRAWNSTFDNVARDLGFKPHLSEPCLYACREKELYLALYVDDAIILDKTEDECNKFITKLNECFETRTIKTNILLGLEVRA